MYVSHNPAENIECLCKRRKQNYKDIDGRIDGWVGGLVVVCVCARQVSIDLCASVNKLVYGKTKSKGRSES